MTPSTHAKICEVLKRYLDDAGMAEVMPLLDNEVDEAAAGAQDAALRPYAHSAVRQVSRFNTALARTKHILGEAPKMTFDSAEAVYAEALTRMGHNISRIAPHAYEETFSLLQTAGTAKAAPMTALGRSAMAKHPGIAASLERVTQL